MTTGEKILFQRKKAGLTQKALGELCNMPDSQIRQYELGKVEPKLENIRRIASALGVYISDLVEDWGTFSKDEIMEDLTDYGGGFYGKEAPKEMQKKITERLFGHKADICKKMDLLNDSGQKKAIEQVDLLTRIPEYQRKDGPQNCCHLPDKCP